MRKLILLTFWTIFSLYSHHSFASNYKKTAHKITAGISNDSLKVVAIYDWVTQHIKYDYKRYYYHQLNQSQQLFYSRLPWPADYPSSITDDGGVSFYARLVLISTAKLAQNNKHFRYAVHKQ